MAIVNMRTGATLTNKQIKSAIQRATGWSDTQYKKEYDVLRNKLRNYEQATGQAGAFKANELLYREQLSKKKYGAAYRPSALLESVRATPSTGTGIVKARGVSIATQRKLASVELKAFKEFIKKSEQAQTVVKAYETGKTDLAGLRAELSRLAKSRREFLKNKRGVFKDARTAARFIKAVYGGY